MDYVYLWADGIHVNIRLEEHKLCLLVLIGVRADGRKERLIALADGYRESAESWADLLRDCARRGMRAPALALPLRSRRAELPQGIEPCQVRIVAASFPVLDRTLGGVEQPSQAFLADFDPLANLANDFGWSLSFHKRRTSF